jgi:hypothetical protein
MTDVKSTLGFALHELAIISRTPTCSAVNCNKQTLYIPLQVMIPFFHLFLLLYLAVNRKGFKKNKWRLSPLKSGVKSFDW